MKTRLLIITIILIAIVINNGKAQSTNNPQTRSFDPRMTFYDNVPYANDTLKKHLLDIYIPPVKKHKYPLIVWIHGGAWMLNDKYADMSYMKETLTAFADGGYAVASIDYRYSTTAPFPAQIQDCNQAVEFLYNNADKYQLDKDRIALIGFSAGGHLASLMALSNNNNIREFYADGKKTKFKIRLCLDFYGPSDFSFLKGFDSTDPKNPITLLLGARAVDRPDLAKKASTVTYIDKNDPPFLIVQGERDESVNPDESVKLNEKLTRAGIASKLIIVPGAPHYGVMFDAADIRKNIFEYLNTYMK